MPAKSGRILRVKKVFLPNDGKNFRCTVYCICFVRLNLQIVQDLNDRAAEGRSCGNLGNTYYLLGDFRQAVRYHFQVNDEKNFLIFLNDSFVFFVFF